MKGVIYLKSNISLVAFLTSLFLITGCTPSNSLKTNETKKEDVISKVDEKVLKMVDSEEQFSYLTNLSEEELKSYKQFVEEYDTKVIGIRQF